MRFSWMWREHEGPLVRLILLPAAFVALFVAGGARLHRALYERGVLARRHLSCRVVSIGNLTTGGSGKTPLAAQLALELQQRGHRVVLASRGYGSRRRTPVSVVSDGRRIVGDLQSSGDEPLLLASRAIGVPVVVGRDRGLAGLRAVAAFDADVLVLDDGFQHHRLARDLEIVAIDGVFAFGNGRVLPRGPLRESASRLDRADALVLVDGPMGAEATAIVERYAASRPRYYAHRKPASLRAFASTEAISPGSLHGMKVGLLAGIAHPENFRRSLEGLGAEVVAERIFADHHRYRAADLRGLARQADIWITTEKDAVKLRGDWLGNVDLRVLRLDLVFQGGSDWVDWIDARLRKATH